MWQRVCRLVALGAGAALAHDNNVGIHDYYADDTSRGVFTSADDHVRARGAGLTLRWSTTSYNMGVDFVLEYSGEAWLGLAISSDGHMVGGGPRWRYASWLQGRQTPTPAFVADWKGGDAGVNHYVMDDYTEKGVRLIGDANGYGIARGPDPTGHMQFPVSARLDGVSSMAINLPYTERCGEGLFAICEGEPTILLLARGSKDFWKSQHPMTAMHALSIYIEPPLSGRKKLPPQRPRDGELRGPVSDSPKTLGPAAAIDGTRPDPLGVGASQRPRSRAQLSAAAAGAGAGGGLGLALVMLWRCRQVDRRCRRISIA